jgi:SAM-dependent methyltransferase
MHPALTRLVATGYTEDNLCRFWRVPVVSDVRYAPAPPPDERPRKHLGAWFALLVAGESLPASLFPPADLTDLTEAGLLEQITGDGSRLFGCDPGPPAQAEQPNNRDPSPVAPVALLRATVALLPVAGVLVAGDRFDAIGEDAVTALDLSAVNVAHCLPERLDGRRVLDVGCGAGLLSLVAARRGARVVGGDVHREALAHARRNAALAGLDISFVESDLFANVSGDFDLIVFNAPLMRAPLAQSGDAPSRYVQSSRGEELALAFLAGARAPEILLHAQLTPAIDAALRARDAAVVQIIFARAPDGTPHALTSIRAGEPPGVRRIEVPLSRFCPHLSRPIVDALHRNIGETWRAAPWLELRDTRRLDTQPSRALAFGAHPIDADDLALLERGPVDAGTLDPDTLARLHRLAALGLMTPA